MVELLLFVYVFLSQRTGAVFIRTEIVPLVFVFGLVDIIPTASQRHGSHSARLVL